MEKIKKILLCSALAFFVATAVVLIGISLAQATEENKLINPGFEQAGITSKEAYGWYVFHSGYQRTWVHYSGSWGIRLYNTDFSQMSGAYQRIDLNQTELKPVVIGGYVRGSRINMSPGSYLGASLYAEIHLKDGSIVYWNSLANYDSFSWRWIGFNTGTLPAVNQPISHIFVVPILAQATGRAYFDDITITEFTPSQAAVTLMFDDGEITTYSEAKPILDNYNFVGSASIITEMVEEDGFMNWTQLKELQENGWEIVSHGITHSDLTSLSKAKMIRELSLSKRTLERQGLQVYNFALPYGTYNSYIIERAARYYSSVRAYEQGDNPYGISPYEVKVKGILNSTTVGEVASWIQQALDNNRWVVIVFHKITEQGDDAYYTTPETFAQMIEVIANSNINIVTYNQGLELFSIKK